jgi:predicted nucleic acid-binding protein
MAHLFDTNILARLANKADAQHAIATATIVELHRRGETLHLTPQVLIEFRSLATRAVAHNGLGLSAQEAEIQAAGFEAAFSMLDDSPGVYPAWKVLVSAAGVIGKQVHDARLVAVCHVHAVTHILTFNVSDFARLAGFGPGIAVVDAASI